MPSKSTEWVLRETWKTISWAEERSGKYSTETVTGEAESGCEFWVVDCEPRDEDEDERKKTRARTARGIKIRMGRRSLGDINIQLFEYSVVLRFVFVNTIVSIKESPCPQQGDSFPEFHDRIT